MPNEALFGQQWYNQGDARVTSDPDVRMALTQSVDMGELAKVVTGDTGAPAPRSPSWPPRPAPATRSAPPAEVRREAAACSTRRLGPGSDGMRAKDGKPLAVKFLYNSAMGPNGTAAAELTTKQWKDLGVTVDMVARTPPSSRTRSSTRGDWDVSWITLNVSSPDQIVGFMSGDAPTNFGHIDNDAYTEGVAKASTMPGTDGCSDLAGRRVEPREGRRRDPVREHHAEHVRQQGGVRDERVDHPDQHPDAGLRSLA